MNQNRTIIPNLTVYGITHAIVDATCAAIVFSLLQNQAVTPNDFFSLVILYNVLAFGLQFILGLAVDHFRIPKCSAVLGCVVTAISAAVLFYNPVFAIILAGVGNALFHVGGGSISLNLVPQKATMPGIYVAPGVVGILVGTLLGKAGFFLSWQFIVLLLIMGIFIYFTKMPEINYHREDKLPSKTDYFEVILLLILISIAVRSLVGSVLVFPWKSDLSLLIVLTVAVVLGKGLGGYIADKFGWMLVGTGSLLISIPLLVFGGNIPILAMIGMFAFNVTMPLTLVVLSNKLPGRPAFAFGLTCLALLLGALPTFTSIKSLLGSQWVISMATIISVISLYYGLRLYFKSSHRQQSDYKARLPLYS